MWVTYVAVSVTMFVRLGRRSRKGTPGVPITSPAAPVPPAVPDELVNTTRTTPAEAAGRGVNRPAGGPV